jgi:hypothetical protein
MSWRDHGKHTKLQISKKQKKKKIELCHRALKLLYYIIFIFAWNFMTSIKTSRKFTSLLVVSTPTACECIVIFVSVNLHLLLSMLHLLSYDWERKKARTRAWHWITIIDLLGQSGHCLYRWGFIATKFH